MKQINIQAFLLMIMVVFGCACTAHAGIAELWATLSHRGKVVAGVSVLGTTMGLVYWWLTHKNVPMAQELKKVESQAAIQSESCPAVPAVESPKVPDIARPIDEFDPLSNQRSLIIINDLMRYDHAQWLQGYRCGGALTTDLFYALVGATAPVYASKTLLAYVSTLKIDDDYINGLWQYWDIYDINAEYCLLLPKRWIHAYQKSFHGLGVVVDPATLVSAADIRYQLTGNPDATTNDIVAQTRPDGSELGRRVFLFNGLASVLVGAVRWNVLINGHGGSIGDAHGLACLNDYLAGMPRQTFINLLEDLSKLTTVRLIYLCTCHSAGDIRQAAFANDGRHRNFDFPIICCSCTDEPVFGTLHFTEFFKQICSIDRLEQTQALRVQAACAALNTQWHPSICWAGTHAFVAFDAGSD